ncbi:Ribosomal protein S18 acetylase RimI [Sinosporangium album]|uniref:Ribosomal protein S18 acetylase RimI n=1 Tax=Sinosporangium album TaxID=504805 RepID=A0A1G8GVM5_9ACTN|nr:GNAT family N-acetyltransferase [Sinosporangium album]SDH98444.1 Ribosomal protein S18 acetylase RimI [Sinosporangium album]
MKIRRITDLDDVVAAGHLFDSTPLAEATQRFLDDERHHLLIAYVDDQPVGMVTGVEMTHPDKGTEMFVYELGVEEPFQKRGIAKALVSALGALGHSRGCHGMWTATGEDNAAAVATYSSVGAATEKGQVVFGWRWE